MLYAFIADVHGQVDRLAQVLNVVKQQEIEQIISLGDIGNDDCYSLLRAAGATGTFGNYEVSGYRHLLPDDRRFVQALPPVFAADGFLASHAVPQYPRDLFNVEDFESYRLRTNSGWRSMFRYPSESDDSFWDIYAELLARNKQVLFHGHNHRQSIWEINPGERRFRRLVDHRIVLQPEAHYIVGVGSIGKPEDGPLPRYAVFDADSHRLELRLLLE